MKLLDRLREMAGRVRGLASTAEMDRKREKWRMLNDLRWTGSPPILVSLEDVAFDEVLSDVGLYVQDPTVRHLLHFLHKQLWYVGLDDDRVIEPWVYNQANYLDNQATLFGVEMQSIKAGASTMFLPSIFTVADVERMRVPALTLDGTWTLKTIDRMNELLRGELEVRTEWRHFSFTAANLGVWATQLIGQERFYEWCATEPDTIRRFMAIVAAAFMRHNDEVLRTGRMEDNDCFVHDFYPWYCVGPGHWVHADGQDFEGVSPEMTEDYLFRFLRPIYELFGHGSYGCCESLDRKAGLVRSLPNLRRVTVSERTDWDGVIDALGPDVVYSVRPGLVETMYGDDARVRAGLRRMAERFKGLHWEVNLPGVMTFNGDPGRYHRWVQMAKDETA